MVNILAGQVSIILLESNTITIVNYPFGLLPKTSGLLFNPIFTWPLRDPGSLSWFTGRVLSFIFLKDQHGQKQRQQGSDKAMRQFCVLSCVPAPRCMWDGKSTRCSSLMKSPLITVQTIFSFVLLWAAWLRKLSENHQNGKLDAAISGRMLSTSYLGNGMHRGLCEQKLIALLWYSWILQAN